jgi:hypothetical protein
MSEYFNNLDQIRNAVRFRLTARADEVLPVDLSAGPHPFDIEPLEKWLFEGFSRQYRVDDDQANGFWLGLSEAIEFSCPVVNGAQAICVKRCADLLDMIGNNFGVEVIKRQSFISINETFNTMVPPCSDDLDDLTTLSSLLRIALLTYEPISKGQSVLAIEHSLWMTIHRRLCADVDGVDAMLTSETLCVLFRAWSILGRREISVQTIIGQWCADGIIDRIRLTAYMKRTFSLLKLSGTTFDEPIWQTFSSNVSGKRQMLGSEVKSSVPRYNRKTVGTTIPAFAIQRA